MRKVKVLYNGIEAGMLEETCSGYTFSYLNTYLKSKNAKSISIFLSISQKEYNSIQLFACFKNKLAEGYNRINLCAQYNIDPDDDMGLICAIAESNISTQDVISYSRI